jgi:hypothetical protein
VSLPPPEQIHLAQTNVTTTLRASWVVQAPLADVQASGQALTWSTSGMPTADVSASCWTFLYGGFNGSFCTGLMSNLAPGQNFNYEVGCIGASSGQITGRMPHDKDSV